MEGEREVGEFVDGEVWVEGRGGGGQNINTKHIGIREKATEK